MCYLMDERGMWNEDRVNQLLHEDSASCIKAMIHGVEGLLDEVVWPHTKNGIYSVKSGYEIIKTQA